MRCFVIGVGVGIASSVDVFGQWARMRRSGLDGWNGMDGTEYVHERHVAYGRLLCDALLYN
jgi:hypothetical protein